MIGYYLAYGQESTSLDGSGECVVGEATVRSSDRRAPFIRKLPILLRSRPRSAS